MRLRFWINTIYGTRQRANCESILLIDQKLTKNGVLNGTLNAAMFYAHYEFLHKILYNSCETGNTVVLLECIMNVSHSHLHQKRTLIYVHI